MTTSSSTNFNQNRNGILNDALRFSGILGDGRTASSDQISFASRVLERLIKRKAASENFRWNMEWLVLNLETSSFVLGSDSNIYECIRKHTSASNTAPITGVKYQGYWVKINAPGEWVTATAYDRGQLVLASDDSYYVCLISHTAANVTEPGSGASYATYWEVIGSHTDDTAYTSSRHIILDSNTDIVNIEGALFREDDSQTLLDITSFDNWIDTEGAANPRSKGQPTGVFFWKKNNDTTNPPEIFLNNMPDSVTDYVLELYVHVYPDDMDAAGYHPDFPQEWLDYLVLETARLIGIRYGTSKDRFYQLREEAKNAKMDADASKGDKGDIQFGVKF